MLRSMTRPEYPGAERLDLTEEIHGHPVADPYRWLEDPADPRTVAWAKAQEQLVDAARETWSGHGRIRARLAKLLASGSVSAPVWRGDRVFFTRRAADQEHAVLLTVDPDGTERVLLDPMALDPAGTTTLDHWVPSKEGDLLTYEISVGGTEEADLYVMEAATGRTVDGPIDRIRATMISWLPGGEAFYYARRLAPELVPADETHYHRRLYLHRIGTDPDTDVLIFGEGRSMTDYYHVIVAPDGRRIAVDVSTGTKACNNVWVADLTTSTADAPVLVPVQVDVDAQAWLRFAAADGPFPDRVYIHTDRDAPRRRLCIAPADDLAYENWRDLISEDPQAVLEDYAILDGPQLEQPLVFAVWTRHAIAEVTVHDLATGKKLRDVSLPGLGTVHAGQYDRRINVRPEGGHEAWFIYSDFVTPAQICRYDAMSEETSLWAASPGAVEVPPVRVRQLSYLSKDGTEVRMFVLDDGSDAGATRPRPTILYGYGGFTLSATPGFDSAILTWVQAGGRYVIANLRGGSEEGEEWHRAGMMAKKQNVFDDFHAAADFLVAEGLTTPEQLGIYGGSNGGLLVGTALTQHPEKYSAVVCSAPLLDMIRYERNGLGELWNEEFGTVADPEQFGWLLAYSPYHNVRDASSGTDYPATLFTVFEGDSRVDPLHARKLAAALQHATSGDRPILLRNETGVGHVARAVSRTVGVVADRLAFLADSLGLGTESLAE